jgi:rhamnosyltransferase
VILTWNAQAYIERLFEGIAKQRLQPDHILVIDSSSTDQTQSLLTKYPAKVHIIPQAAFDHGGTRRLAQSLVDADIYIYMTQDAVPADPDTFKKLVAGLLSSDKIGCAYARQLPHADANPLAAHLRLFNYPPESQLKSLADIPQLGIKTCFNSDSCAAYSKTALEMIGGFPKQAAMAEDVIVAAKMLLAGKNVQYVADSLVYHSHNFNLRQEFQRYFAIGVFHRNECWIIEQFKAPTSEGYRFIRSEITYLIQTKQWGWLPYAASSWLAKWLGYKLGTYHFAIPLKWRVKWGLR